MAGEDEPRRASMLGLPPTARPPVQIRSPARRGRKPKIPRPVEESDNDDNTDSVADETDKEKTATADETTENEKEEKAQKADESFTPPPRKRKRGRPADPNSVRAQKKRERELRDKARREAAKLAKLERGEQETADDSEDRDEQHQSEVEEEEVEVTINEMPEKDEDKFSPFQRYCDFVLRKLIAKDTEEYFMYPVSASSAPDYNTIIEKPMDFFTIQKKIIDNEYTNLEELKVDVALISENAMKYNEQHSIYHMAAMKLQNVARYYFGDDYLEFAKYHLPYGREVSRETLGLTDKNLAPIKAVVPTKDRGLTAAKLKSKQVTAKQVLADCNPALRKKLTTEVPKWDMGYVDNQDGALSLNIVTQSSKPRVTLGDIVGKLETGHSGLVESHEGVYRTLQPSSYLNYEPFASFAPQYDTTWATLSQRDTDLLMSTYGDKDNASGVMQLRQMVLDSGSDFIHAFDDMLNELTDGEHSRTMEAVGMSEEEFEKYMEEESARPTSPNSLRQLLDEIATLKNIGIDTAFTEEIKQDVGLSGDMGPDEQLTRNGVMIRDLAHLQNQRYTRTVTNLADVPEASETELQLVNNIQHNIQEQIIQFEVVPNQVVSTHAIHDAIGLNEEEDCDYDVLREFMEDI